MRRNSHAESATGSQPAAAGILAMGAMMAVCCLGMLLLVTLITLVGWPAGIAVGVLGGGALLFAHWRLMGHGAHH